MRRQLWMAALAVMLLSGCGTWFGESDGPPLPGERISVIQQQSGPSADPQARSEPLVLPPPQINSDWPQAGGDASHVMQSLQAGNVGRPNGKRISVPAPLLRGH